MIQEGPAAKLPTPLHEQQAGVPVRVHPEQSPGGSCMPMSLWENPRTSEGKRLGQMEGAPRVHYSRGRALPHEKGRVPPVVQVGGSSG